MLKTIFFMSKNNEFFTSYDKKREKYNFSIFEMMLTSLLSS